MCFDLDSRPPIQPIAGGSLDSGEVTLTSRDGTPFSAFHARAAEPTGAGIVVIPDVRGLHAYYEDLALRFAEHGVDAVTVDLYARTAGLGRRGADFDFGAHVPETRIETIRDDVAAAVAHLRSPDGATVRSMFTVGFCFGGRISLLANTFGLDLAGVIGFYGWPTGPYRNGMPAPADVAGEMRAPVLALFGGADEKIPPADVGSFEAALATAGVAHEVVTYPDAPHSFFDRKADRFADESADAWQRVLGFVRSNTAGA